MSNKFVIGDHVRVTNPTLADFDRTGVVAGYAELDCEPASAVQLYGVDGWVTFKQSSLTLADPDVHTVLDQMDAESKLGDDVRIEPEPLADWEIELLGGRRSVILRTAEKLINGQRAKDYDTKDDASGNFTRIGNLWEQILGVPVNPEQVALCMAQVKIARLITSPMHEDSWIDLAGYAALGGEIAAAEAAQ